MAEKEKCLVCILAQVRASELTWISFKKNVLTALDADLALCVGTDKNSSKKNGYYHHAKYVWEYVEPYNYAEAFDYAKSEFKSCQDWRLLLKIKGNWLGGIKDGTRPGSGAILIFFRWLLAKKLLENKLLSKYDRFIITRSDYLYRASHPPLNLISPKNIWLPFGQDWGGYTDRHLVASNVDIVKCLNLMDKIILQPKELYKELYKEMKDREDEYSLEKYLTFHIQNNGLEHKIKRFPRVMFAVRGEKDKTRTMPGYYDKKLNLIVKYKSELNESSGIFYEVIKQNGWKQALALYRLVDTNLFFLGKCKDWKVKRFLKKMPKLYIIIKCGWKLYRLSLSKLVYLIIKK